MMDPKRPNHWSGTGLYPGMIVMIGLPILLYWLFS